MDLSTYQSHVHVMHEGGLYLYLKFFFFKSVNRAPTIQTLLIQSLRFKDVLCD